MNDQKGFSLVESLIALSLGLLLMLACSRLFLGAIQVWQSQALAAHLAARFGLDARFVDLDNPA